MLFYSGCFRPNRPITLARTWCSWTEFVPPSSCPGMIDELIKLHINFKISKFLLDFAFNLFRRKGFADIFNLYCFFKMYIWNAFDVWLVFTYSHSDQNSYNRSGRIRFFWKSRIRIRIRSIWDMIQNSTKKNKISIQ